ncbi:MAG: DUF305 domain-containing protein [Gemmatimonadaceae bacterium]|nr:DUF305 domain-containing protein [Gloeobacterales cyanobacterium ES-bin-141]
MKSSMKTLNCALGLLGSWLVVVYAPLPASAHPEPHMEPPHDSMSAVTISGDPDRDFAAMMLPHHQGAIDMARAELLHGKDPVLRRLAQEIIADQQSEIDHLRLWMSRQQSLSR